MSWTTLKRYLVLCIINFNLEYQTSGSNVIKYEVTIFPAFAKRILEGEVISSANNTLYIAVLQQTIPFLSNDLLSITAEVEMVSFVYCQIKEIEKDCFRNQNVVKQIVICMNEISVIRRRNVCQSSNRVTQFGEQFDQSCGKRSVFQFNQFETHFSKY
jgi:hypothetical protein